MIGNKSEIGHTLIRRFYVCTSVMALYKGCLMSATEDEVEVLWQPPVIPVWAKRGLMITDAAT